MELKDQVVSLELAKRLKELGVRQESHFKWNVPTEKPWDEKLYTEAEWEIYADENLPPDSEMFAAFTVAELGEMIKDEGSAHETWFRKDTGKWVVGYNPANAAADTEADARAKMLIYLLENQLITV